jgi:hypothetical protein
MDLQQIFNNAMAAKRAERQLTSSQFTLIELLTALKAVKNQNLPLVYDGGEYVPTEIDSWRGAYAELAMDYREKESVEKIKTVAEWCEILSEAIGKTFEGYKGGDFRMGKTTSIWVANYGNASGFKSDKENDLYYQGIVGVEEHAEHVSLLSEPMDS